MRSWKGFSIAVATLGTLSFTSYLSTPEVCLSGQSIRRRVSSLVSEGRLSSRTKDDDVSALRWKRKMKSAADTNFAFEPNFTSMRLHDMLHDSQPQTSSAGLTGAGAV